MLLIDAVPLASLSGEDMAQAEAWLGEEERNRLSSISRPRRRTQFLAARWLARKRLSMLMNEHPGTITIGSQPGSPPSLSVDHLFLSLSHSPDWAACAIATHPVGVDIEQYAQGRAIRAMAQWVCNEQQQALLDTLNDEAAERCFRAWWTIKESWLKFHAAGFDPALMAKIAVLPSTADLATTLSLSLNTSTTLSVCSVPGGLVDATLPCHDGDEQYGLWQLSEER